MSTVFETEVCSRCRGTGHFSFNGEHSRCYKCDGKNGARALTKRGAAAKAWFDARMTLTAGEVKVGDMIRTENTKQLTVAKIAERDAGLSRYTSKGVVTEKRIVEVIFTNAAGLEVSVAKGGTVRRVLKAADLSALQAAALAYQETLTTNGIPRWG